MVMNIVVCAKDVVDASEMKIDSSTNMPIVKGIPKKISDIDKNAIEEAIKIKEKHGGKITVLTVGQTDSKERIKELLAMGADEGILIPYPEKYDYHIVTKLLAKAIMKIKEYDIILCGEASTDLFSGQVGPKIAGILNIPQITYAFNLNVENNKIIGDRNMGENSVTTESTYPVLITVTKEINEPRLPSLMAILGAANKPIHDWAIDSLLSVTDIKIETIDIKGVSMERKNLVFKDDVDDSISKLVENLAKDGVLG
jgi:electron transfer flavoprotein beta subunit